MSKYADIDAVAKSFQTLGAITLVVSLISALANQNIFFMIYGVVGFLWLYAVGGALLILIDISKSVRASAIIAAEQDDRRKAKTKDRSSNGKSLGLKPIAPEKKPETGKSLGLKRIDPNYDPTFNRPTPVSKTPSRKRREA